MPYVYPPHSLCIHPRRGSHAAKCMSMYHTVIIENTLMLCSLDSPLFCKHFAKDNERRILYATRSPRYRKETRNETQQQQKFVRTRVSH